MIAVEVFQIRAVVHAVVRSRVEDPFERAEPVVYGLTKNIDSYNPAVIASHEWVDIAEDVATAENWHDRWSFLLRGPGWAYHQRALTGRDVPAPVAG